jgi:SAM-dependent methyltransferase
MHESSLDRCRDFIQQYLQRRDRLRIADVGSYDVNGTYRPLFDRPGWEYVGLDIVAGANVDVVLPEGDDATWPHANEFDVVVSGQCVEHVRKPWKWIKQVATLAKVGGLIWITGPNTWVFHEHPIDCWRIWPDGMRALFDEAGLQEIACGYCGTETVGIAFKPSTWDGS